MAIHEAMEQQTISIAKVRSLLQKLPGILVPDLLLNWGFNSFPLSNFYFCSFPPSSSLWLTPELFIPCSRTATTTCPCWSCLLAPANL